MQPTQNTAVLAESPAEPGPIDVAATLRQAADYLIRNGRITGALYKPGFGPGSMIHEPCACLVGALALVTFGQLFESPVLRTDDPAWPDFILALVWMDQYLDELYDQDSYQFNDDAERTTEEVCAALRHAAVLWEHIELAVAA